MTGRGNVRHLYVHLPFCSHRCGYCDFVTVVDPAADHGAYVDALLADLARVQPSLADTLTTIFVGGGTPTLTRPADLERLLAALPPAAEVTVEANPETVTGDVARLLMHGGVTRMSLGAQSFQPEVLDVLERRGSAAQSIGAYELLREVGFATISLDLIYGVPGQTGDDLVRDLDRAIALAPEHLSCYELEAKPGTPFTRTHGALLSEQAEAMEAYYEEVVDTLQGAGYRWYETANFCRPDPTRDLRAQHNLAVWRGEDYVGIGLGAVSTLGTRRERVTASLRRYLDAHARNEEPPRSSDALTVDVRKRELLMLGLRLDEGVELAEIEDVIDPEELERMCAQGLAERSGGRLHLTRRGRFLANSVTIALTAADGSLVRPATLCP